MNGLTHWHKDTEGYYNNPGCDVYVYHLPGGRIYLMDKKNYTFTVSRGPDHDGSYTGSCFGMDEIQTLEQAAEYVLRNYDKCKTRR